jgi:PAS domain S-box-containing protein
MGQTKMVRQSDGAPRRASAEALLEAVVDTSDDAIFTCDAGGRITSWSSTSVRLFGRDTTDVHLQPFEQLFAEHLRPGIRSITERVAAGDRIQHFETEALRADGLPMPVSLSICPVVDGSDVDATWVVVVRDVTEQRLAQATLAEMESRLQEGEAIAHVGSWLWDLRTGTVQWSAEFYRIHSVDPLDFDGTIASHLAAIHPADRNRIRAEMEKSVRTGRPFEDEYQVLIDDDDTRLVRVRAQPAFGSDGVAVGLRGLGQDVTEQEPT